MLDDHDATMGAGILEPRRRDGLRMRTFDEIRHDSTRHQFTGPVRVRAPHGLNATAARAVVAEARRHRATATLTAHGRGQRADGRNLLELLLLGAGRDEALTLECVGDDARAAFEAIAAVLGIGQQETTP